MESNRCGYSETTSATLGSGHVRPMREITGNSTDAGPMEPGTRSALTGRCMNRRVARSAHLVGLAALASVVGFGCAGTYESSVRHDIDATREQHAWSTERDPESVDEVAATDASSLQSGLAAYVALALHNNPEIRAAFERWQAFVHRISRARRLPEPTLSFGVFLRSVETRVGPQQGRVSLQQAFPWPTKLTAGADAASAQARAMQRRFEAQSLMVSQRVATAYWNLWQLRTTRTTQRQHLDVIKALAETVRARLATGEATLSDASQIDLTAARFEDTLFALDEAERAAEAQLRAALGVQGQLPVPTAHAPESPTLPTEDREALARAAQAHPMIVSMEFMAEASESTARAESAGRYPTFTLGGDWIIVGDGGHAGVSDPGKDAIMVMAGMVVPLWQGSYADTIDAARAEARAQRAEQEVLADRAEAELTTALSLLADAARRSTLYQHTLVPQAQSVYESVLGAYTVGRGTVAQALLAQRDLLELRVELDRARADHARAWSRLEEIVGRHVQRAEPAAEAEQ